MTTQTVEIFYSFQCPYSYLAMDRYAELESKFDIKVLWQPFSAKVAGKGFPTTPVPPEKISYIREDSIRLAQEMNMPLAMTDSWPENEFDPEKSLRGALIASDMEVAIEYNIKMFQQWWEEGQNPNDSAFIVQLCEELDIDLNEFTALSNSSDTRERVKNIFKRGKKYGIFETPTILINEERFVGLDRIDAAEKKLRAMGLAKKPRASAAA